MKFLIDTNVISELRKGVSADRGLRGWFELSQPTDLFLSVVTLGELRRGIELKRRRDLVAANGLEAWAHRLTAEFSDRILPIDLEVAEVWGRLSAIRTIDGADGLLAATALVHDLTLVTRNTDDFVDLGVDVLNPFGH